MQRSSRNTLQLLWTYIRPQWRRTLLLAILLLASIGSQLYSPQIIRQFIDQATQQAPISSLVWLAVLFLIVAVCTQVLTLGATALSAQVAWQATNALRADLVSHCMRLDLSFHNARTPGELIERVDGDVGTLSDFFSKLVIQVIGSVLLLSGILLVLFFEDWRIGLALSIFTVIAAIALYLIREIAVPSNAANMQAHAMLFGLIEERIAGIDDLRANGGGWYVMRRFQEAMRNVLLKGRKALVLGGTIWFAVAVLFGTGIATALAVGTYLYLNGLITLGTVFLFVQYTQLLRIPLEQLSDQLKLLQQAIASIDRIREIFSYRSTVLDGASDQALPDGPLSVSFEQASFAYNDGLVNPETGEDGSTRAVLSQLNFMLKPGEVVGLLGRTGSGKTTIMRLLLRLYDVTEGAIRLGGIDLRETTIGRLRSRIGVVTQDVQLFQASVRDNLTLFDPSISDERIMEVIEQLGLSDWLRSLPNGLDSELSHGNGGLSAGEAQLLAFARVFLRDPGLVILDEASSRLDPATERLIERAIDQLLKDRTAIIIAHRLGTVQRADSIMILDGGRIREHGPRQALLANPNSHFSHLMRTGMEEVLS
jgi:ABC-type multidrug transport system, ATPase and permease components